MTSDEVFAGQLDRVHGLVLPAGTHMFAVACGRVGILPALREAGSGGVVCCMV